MPRRKVLRWFRDKPVIGEENDVEQTGLGVNGNRLERSPSRGKEKSTGRSESTRDVQQRCITWEGCRSVEWS